MSIVDPERWRRAQLGPITKKWKQVRQGDRIVCPNDGHGERVLFNRRLVNGKRHVRTSRHDHFKQPDREVQVTEVKK